jgi:energy-coupling factor transport system ATP-binding protein
MRLRVEEALNLVDLHNLRERRLDTLSGGERQRLAIAAAMALRPKILIMDEPTSQLDPQSAEEVLQSVVRLNEELGLTVILVEQRLERVARYADRLIYMEDGRIVVDAPVREAITKVRPTLMSPLTRLARGLDWQPVPLTIKEGLRFVEAWSGVESSDGFGQTKLGGNGHAPEPLLQAHNLHFAYNGTPVLQGVGLMVRPGETVALLGRNGSGKSTLLRCLVGLLRPAKGSVWVGGESTQDRSVAEICKQVAYLPQTPDDLLFADTVAEELDITLSNHGCDITEMRESSERLLADMGLGSQSQSYPRDLSVGQRQRVALGAVMVTRPRLLLLDEPTRGLDYESKRNLAALWQRWKEAGMGLLLVTHDVELVAQVADRVMVISEGEIIADGPAADVLTASSLFTPQVARLFPGRGWLTVEDALAELRPDEIG